MLAKVREVIHEADPEIVEEQKWAKATSPGTPVFSHGGIVCTGETYKRVVKITFAKGAVLKDPKGLFQLQPRWECPGAPSTSTKATKINEPALKDLIRAAVAPGISRARARPNRRRDDVRPATASSAQILNFENGGPHLTGPRP